MVRLSFAVWAIRGVCELENTVPYCSRKWSRCGICSRSEGTFGLSREKWTLSKTMLITCRIPLPSWHVGVTSACCAPTAPEAWTATSAARPAAASAAAATTLCFMASLPWSRCRLAAAAPPAPPPGEATAPAEGRVFLLGEELGHRGDLRRVRRVGEARQVPDVLDRGEQRVVVVRGRADVAARLAAAVDDDDRRHEPAAVDAAGPGGADVRVAGRQHRRVAAAGGRVPAAGGRIAGVVALVGDDEDRVLSLLPGRAGHDRLHRLLDEGVGLLLQGRVVRVVVRRAVRAGRLGVARNGGVHPAVHVVALVGDDEGEVGRRG